MQRPEVAGQCANVAMTAVPGLRSGSLLAFCIQQLCLCYFAGAGLSNPFLDLISGCAELLYRSAHPSGEFGQLLRSEQEEYNEKDYHHVRPGKIKDSGDHWSHKHVG